MSEMKRCPFCGGEVEATSETFYNELVEEHGSAGIEIRCNNLDCGCVYWTYPRHFESKAYKDALKVAIERWNHRAEV